MTHTSKEQLEARIAEMEAEIERLRKLHQDAYRRGFQAGSRGLREAYDAVQEVRRQDAWGNSHLTEALIAAEDRAERAEARAHELEAQLVKEAARTAEQKLRADQLEQQHAMQAKMHAQAAEQLAAAQQGE